MVASLEEFAELYSRPTLTRWGIKWDGDMPTAEPLLSRVEKPYQEVYFDEAQGYTWLCYVRLKGLDRSW